MLRALDKSTVWPGEFIELELPLEVSEMDSELALEPHIDDSRDRPSSFQWPLPTLLLDISDKI